MILHSNNPKTPDRHAAAYAWRPAAMLFLALAGLIYLIESDLLQTAIEAVLGSPLR